jgi:hypothetical protein
VTVSYENLLAPRKWSVHELDCRRVGAQVERDIALAWFTHRASVASFTMATGEVEGSSYYMFAEGCLPTTKASPRQHTLLLHLSVPITGDGINRGECPRPPERRHGVTTGILLVTDVRSMVSS